MSSFAPIAKNFPSADQIKGLVTKSRAVALRDLKLTADLDINSENCLQVIEEKCAAILGYGKKSPISNQYGGAEGSVRLQMSLQAHHDRISTPSDCRAVSQALAVSLGMEPHNVSPASIAGNRLEMVASFPDLKIGDF